MGSARSHISGGYEKTRGEFTLHVHVPLLHVSFGVVAGIHFQNGLHHLCQKLLRAGGAEASSGWLRNPCREGQRNGVHRVSTIHSTGISRRSSVDHIV